LSTAGGTRNRGVFPHIFKIFVKKPNLTLEEESLICYIFCSSGGRLPLPFKVTEVQPTPNPNAVKFVLDRVIGDRPMSFLNAASGKEHPIASKLFAIPGVTGLLLLGDFITVNKQPAARWADITKQVEQALASL
jgi:scaffold Nfu/NifU family protein